MARSSNRTGFGNNRGSINPPIHIGDTAPINPVYKHIWIDTNACHLYWWDGSTWIVVV